MAFLSCETHTIFPTKPIKTAQKSSSLTFKLSKPTNCKATASTSMKPTSLKLYEKRESGKDHVAAYERWMSESVVEIVKNLNESPLLVHVYGGDEPRFQPEHAVAEDWDLIKRKWEKSKSDEFPQGMIFVKELESEDCDGITRTWGIIVQARGSGNNGCYLLKTSRVAGFEGLCCNCTHFCLIKVRDFRQLAQSQFQSSWLL